MIFGFIAVVLFALVAIRRIDKRLKRNGILTKIHVPLGIMLILVIIAHAVTTFPLWASRPDAAIWTGIAALAFILIAAISAMKKMSALHRVFALCATLCILLHIVFNIMGVAQYQNDVASTTVAEVNLSEIPDGTYVGEHDVGFIYAKAEVTVKEGGITDIALLEHRNERGGAAETIVTAIIQQQKVDVDAVSGATNSSTIIKKAVENALR